MDVTLPLAHFRLQVRALTPIRFHHYSGSAWRGLFGHSLRKIACVTGQKSCNGCLLRQSCVYVAIFETPPPEGSRYMRRSNTAPHPFILTPPFGLRNLVAGESTELDLVLVGRSSQYLPYFVHAFERAGNRGIGVEEGRYELADVHQQIPLGSDQWRSIYQERRLDLRPAEMPPTPPRPETVTLRFESPLRVRYQDRIMVPERFAFAGVVANLLRRVSMLSYFQGGGELRLDFRALVDHAAGLRPVASQLHWHQWQRYSSRQKKTIRMSGIIGQISYRGEDLAELWPLIWLGQWLHIGKGTSMGLGAYRVIGAMDPVT